MLRNLEDLQIWTDIPTFHKYCARLQFLLGTRSFHEDEDKDRGWQFQIFSYLFSHALKLPLKDHRFFICRKGCQQLTSPLRTCALKQPQATGTCWGNTMLAAWRSLQRMVQHVPMFDHLLIHIQSMKLKSEFNGHLSVQWSNGLKQQRWWFWDNEEWRFNPLVIWNHHTCTSTRKDMASTGR